MIVSSFAKGREQEAGYFESNSEAFILIQFNYLLRVNNSNRCRNFYLIYSGNRINFNLLILFVKTKFYYRIFSLFCQLYFISVLSIKHPSKYRIKDYFWSREEEWCSKRISISPKPTHIKVLSIRHRCGD